TWVNRHDYRVPMTYLACRIFNAIFQAPDNPHNTSVTHPAIRPRSTTGPICSVEPRPRQPMANTAVEKVGGHTARFVKRQWRQRKSRLSPTVGTSSTSAAANVINMTTFKGTCSALSHGIWAVFCTLDRAATASPAQPMAIHQGARGAPAKPSR